VIRNGEKLPVSTVPLKVGGFPLQPGDVIVTLVAGGAGYGDPLDREPEMVAHDVAQGYVSVEGAFSDYGVVLEQRGQVDHEQTHERRETLRSARQMLVVASTDSDHYDEDGRRIARISPTVAAILGVETGDILEYVPSSRPALRAWAEVDPTLLNDETPLGPQGREICGVQEGGVVWLRSPWTHIANVRELPDEFHLSFALLHGGERLTPLSS
jgi:N-methylhydantoinase B